VLISSTSFGVNWNVIVRSISLILCSLLLVVIAVTASALLLAVDRRLRR